MKMPTWDELVAQVWSANNAAEDCNREHFEQVFDVSWEYDMQADVNEVCDTIYRCHGEKQHDIGTIVDMLKCHHVEGRQLAVIWWTYMLWRMRWQVGVDKLLRKIVTSIPTLSGAPHEMRARFRGKESIEMEFKKLFLAE